MLGGLLPALATAQSVTYDYRPTQDFSRLKTYTFKDVPKSDNPFVDERIAAAVAAQLARARPDARRRRPGCLRHRAPDV